MPIPPIDSSTLYGAVVSYNGVTFPNQHKLRIICRVQPDSANRTTKYVVNTLTLECILYNNMFGDVLDGGLGQLDSAPGMSEVRRRLQATGGALVVSGKGFGEAISINTSNSHDLVYGPHPRILVWEPIAHGAVRIVWTVDVTLANTQTATHRVLESTYSMRWSISDGLTTRTISGQIEIAGYRVSPSAQWISDTADRYRDLYQIPLVTGFHRTTNDWALSPDKRSIQFTVVDVELESEHPYYPGIVRIDVDYDLANSGLSFQKWNATLSGSITVAKGYPRWFGWLAFLEVVRSKRDAVNRQYSETDGAKIVMTNVMRFREKVFGRSMSFTIGWILSCPITKLFVNGGLWEPVLGGSWEQWKLSMMNTSGNRGAARMSHSTADDLIVSVDNPQTIITIQGLNALDAQIAGLNLFDMQCPPKEYSYLRFENVYTPTVVTNQSVIQPLASLPPPVDQRPVSESDLPPGATAVTAEGTIIQPEAPRYYVQMTGYALRAGFEVPAFNLVSYGGQKATLVGEAPRPGGLVGNMGCPLYGGSWDVKYALAGPPSGELAVVQQIDSGKKK